jgi:hypothetical protein
VANEPTIPSLKVSRSNNSHQNYSISANPVNAIISSVHINNNGHHNMGSKIGSPSQSRGEIFKIKPKYNAISPKIPTLKAPQLVFYDLEAPRSNASFQQDFQNSIQADMLR